MNDGAFELRNAAFGSGGVIIQSRILKRQRGDGAVAMINGGRQEPRTGVIRLVKTRRRLLHRDFIRDELSSSFSSNKGTLIAETTHK